MSAPKHFEPLGKGRKRIADVVRALRKARSWTQAELAKRLELSQNRLSEIERGDGSFTAEQFLRILQLFNVGVSEFGGAERDRKLEVQNALARLGASHLHESTSVLPSKELEDVHDVIREALLLGEPRLLAAIAPVLVAQFGVVNLAQLSESVVRLGYERRLAWIIANTLAALDMLVHTTARKDWAKLRRRVDVTFQIFLDMMSRSLPNHPLDAIDPAIRSRRTLEEVQRQSSPISKRWGIITSLQPEDFVEALEASHVAG